MKKFMAFLIIISVMALTFVPCFASDNIINITRPEGSEESTFKKTYVIAGNTNKESVTVELAIYSPELGYYVPYKNTEDEYSWEIGSSGMFMKEVSLPYTGANKIQVTAYKLSDPSDRQVASFTITYLNRDIKDRIVNGVLNFSEVFKSTFIKIIETK